MAVGSMIRSPQLATAEDVGILAAKLSAKIELRRPDIARHVDYLRGEQGRLMFVSEEFKRYFSARFKNFSDNWCLPVAQAPVERMRFKGLQATTGEIPASVMRAWDRCDADRGLSEAALMMTAARRSFGLVTQLPNGLARISFEHPDSCALLYDALTGLPYAGLVVRQDDRREYGTLLTPTQVFDVSRARPGYETDNDRRLPPTVQGWSFNTDSARPNPLGVVPLVEFRNQSLLDNRPMSDIELVETMQDTVNVVWAYLLNGLDYASLPARVIMGGDRLEEPVIDDTTGEVVGARPAQLDRQINERILQITGTDVSIGEWSASNLNAFVPVIEKAVEHIAAETRTPGHYLLTKSNVPATGYDVAEAGLVSKTNERIGYMRSGIRELLRLAALTEGDTTGALAVENSRVIFASPLYRSDAQLMDALLKAKQIGFPFAWLAEQYGLGPDEVSRVLLMQREEAEDPELAKIARTLEARNGSGLGADSADDAAESRPLAGATGGEREGSDASME